jgi:hypothetical protein
MSPSRFDGDGISRTTLEKQVALIVKEVLTPKEREVYYARILPKGGHKAA